MATTPYPFVAGAVLTASQLNSTFNVPVNAQTASYVLVASDAGKRVQMNAAGATTITVNTSLFSAGDNLFIQNIGAGTCTITAGTATVSTSGSLALAQYGGGTLYFTSASAAIFFPSGGIGYGVATGGTSSPITVSGINYTLLSFTSSGTLTVTKSGLFDVYAFGGGASGGSVQQSTGVGGGGGAGGGIISTLYLDANQTITVGAGGSGSQTVAGNGTTSTVGTKLFATGGGVGAFKDNNGDAHSPQQGGCGGGGARMGSGSPFATGGTGQIGFKGGDYVSGTNSAAAGGGGMSAVGGNATTNTGGAGGAGVDVSTFIGAGSSLFKAGGGGGGGATTGGAGGSSVGGAGFSGATGVGAAAGANTASGGGGSIDNGTATRLGGNGGSGIVYIRFKV